MDIVKLLNEVVFVYVEAWIFLLLFSVVVGKRNFVLTSPFASIFFTVFYTLFTRWVTLYVPFGIHTILISVFCVLYLGYITKTGLISAFSIWALLAAIMIVIEMVTFLFFIVFTGSNFQQIADNPVYIFTGTIAVKIVEIAIIIVAYRFRFDKYIKYKLFRGEKNVPSLIIVQAFLLGVTIASVNYAVSQPVELVQYNIFLLAIYLMIIFLTFLDFREQEQLRSVQKKHALLQEHLKNIETIISLIRKEKHDFSNHLNTIYGLCTLNKADMADRIKKYIHTISEKPYFSNKSVDTGNDYIDALIAVKNNQAVDHGIRLTIDFRSRLDLVDIEDKELVAIFGNIIDNAFDALSTADGIEVKSVIITTFMIDRMYYISIKNNGPMIPEKNLKRVFANGFSTKAENKADHGYGLYIVSQMLERNGGSINATSDAEETEFLVKLKVRSENREYIGEQAG